MQTKDGGTTPLQNEILVLTKSLPYDNSPTQYNAIEHDSFEKKEYPFILFLTNVLVWAQETDSSQTSTPTLDEFIREQAKDHERCDSFSAVGQPSSSLSSDADEALVRFSLLTGVS